MLQCAGCGAFACDNECFGEVDLTGCESCEAAVVCSSCASETIGAATREGAACPQCDLGRKMIAAVDRAAQRGYLHAREVLWAAEFWAQDLQPLFEDSLRGRLIELRDEAHRLLVKGAGAGSPAVRCAVVNTAGDITLLVASDILEAAVFDAPVVVQDALIELLRRWRKDASAMSRIVARAPVAVRRRHRRATVQRKGLLSNALLRHEGISEWDPARRRALAKELASHGIVVARSDFLVAPPRRGALGLGSLR